MSGSKVLTLEEAIRRHVVAEMHLNFASTPFRSNASIRALGRVFRGKDPRFVLSATGFHSTAHLLPLLRLGRRYISTFFGDNYPIPRPNPVYSQVQAEGAALEFWSLGSYVAALRAGALGNRHAVTRSLLGSTMAEDLAAAGRFHTVEVPGDEGPEIVGMVKAIRPDVTFIHGLVGDARGNVLLSKPVCEGVWGALAAREGAIVTVERVVDHELTARYPDAIAIPSHRVLAVCEAPFGVHPQPLLPLPYADLPHYPDDFDHYRLWRDFTREPALFERFCEEVLDAPDAEAAYRQWVGPARLKRLARAERNLPPDTPPARQSVRPTPDEAWPQTAPNGVLKANTARLVLAARLICQRVVAGGYPVILAGIGHSFLAARLAKLWLAQHSVDVKVMIEIGMFDVECGPTCHPFLLSYDNMRQAERVSSVEDVLSTVTCGADNRCLGVIGAGQIDPRGHINSTRIGGRMLVGSGGANDIASAAAEVVVLTRCSPARMVPEVDYITSPGRAVRHVVTGACVFERQGDAPRWRVGDVYPLHGGRPLAEVLETIRASCPWDFEAPEGLQYAPVISTAELKLLYLLDPDGDHWEREPARAASWQ